MKYSWRRSPSASHRGRACCEVSRRRNKVGIVSVLRDLPSPEAGMGQLGKQTSAAKASTPPFARGKGGPELHRSPRRGLPTPGLRCVGRVWRAVRWPAHPDCIHT